VIPAKTEATCTPPFRRDSPLWIRPSSRESRSRISDAGRRFDATRAQPTSRLISFVSLAILQKHVVSSNAVDRRRRPRFEQHQLRLHGRRLDRRRFPLAFPLAQEASSPSQEQKRTPGTGETAQEASPESRTESRLHSQPDQAVDAEQRANLLRWVDRIPPPSMNYPHPACRCRHSSSSSTVLVVAPPR